MIYKNLQDYSFYNAETVLLNMESRMVHKSAF